MKRVGHKEDISDYICRKTNIMKSSPDHTRNCIVPLANKHDVEVVETSVEIGKADPVVVNEHGLQEYVKINHHYFHPKKHIPLRMSSDDCNMSPVEGNTF